MRGQQESATVSVKSRGTFGGLADSRLWPVVVFIVAVLATCSVLIFHLMQLPLYYPSGDLGQTFWNYWWFDFGAVGQGRNPLRSDWLFYPTGCGLTFHTMGLFYCVVFWPVRAWLGTAAAYNLQIVATYAATMFFTYGLARELGASRFAGALAGLGAGLGRYRFTFAFQMNVLSTQWIPLYFWMLIRVLRREGETAGSSRRWARDASWLGFSVACMLTTDWHYLLFCLTVKPLFLIAAWLRERRMFLQRWFWMRAGVAALVAAPFLVFYGWNAVAETREFPTQLERSERQRIDNSASLSDYLFCPRLAAALSGDVDRSPLLGRGGLTVDRMFFLPGYVLAVLGLAFSLGLASSLGLTAARSQGRPSAFGPRFWMILAACAMILSFGPELIVLKKSAFERIATGIAMPYAALQRLPVFRDVAQLYRFGYFVTLALAVAGALGADAAISHCGRRAPRLLPPLAQMVLAGAVFAECYAGYYPLAEAEPSAYSEFLRQQKGDFAILELPDDFFNLLGYYMYEQTIHEKRLMGGYTSRPNRRFDEFAAGYPPIIRLRGAVAGLRPKLSASERREFLEQAGRGQLRFIVLHHAIDSPLRQTRATRNWLVAENLAAPAFEDRDTSVLRVASP